MVAQNSRNSIEPCNIANPNPVRQPDYMVCCRRTASYSECVIRHSESSYRSQTEFRMPKPLSLILITLTLAAVLSAALSSKEPADRSDAPIVVLCAASNRGVMEAIRQDYEQEFGRSVLPEYGASQTLLSTLEVTRTGDLYLPADDSYLGMALQKGLIEEVLPLARMHLVVGVKRGNPLRIQELEDLRRPDVRFVQANPDAAAVGMLTRQILQPLEKWESLANRTTTFRSTVTEATNDVKIGAADATITYDAVLHLYPDLEPVRLPEFEIAWADVRVGIVKRQPVREEVLHFARYLGAKDRGLRRYAELGFTPVDGPQWESKFRK